VSCPTPQEIAGLADGTLPAGRRMVVESHVLACSTCARDAVAVEAMDDLLCDALIADERARSGRAPEGVRPGSSLLVRLDAIGREAYERRGLARGNGGQGNGHGPGASARAGAVRPSARVRPATPDRRSGKLPAPASPSGRHPAVSSTPRLPPIARSSGTALGVLGVASLLLAGLIGYIFLARPDAGPDGRGNAARRAAGRPAAEATAPAPAAGPEVVEPAPVAPGTRPEAPPAMASRDAAAPAPGAAAAPAAAIASGPAPEPTPAVPGPAEEPTLAAGPRPVPPAPAGAGNAGDGLGTTVASGADPEPPAVEAAAPRSFEPFALAWTRGDLRVRDPGAGAFARVAPGTRLLIASGQTLRAGPGGASFGFGRGIEVALKPSSEVRLEGDSGDLDGAPGLALPAPRGYVATLEKGALYAEVLPNGHGARSFRVLASGIEARVTGTRFEVALAPSAVSIAVYEGNVRVTREADGSVVGVGRGEEATARDGAATAVRRLTDSGSIPSWASAVRGKRTVQYGTSFDRGNSGWEADVVAPGASGAGRAILLREVENQHWGVGTKLVRAGAIFRARASGTAIRFSYFFEGESAPILVQFKNATQKADYCVAIDEPVVGRWTTVQLDLSEFTRFEGGVEKPIREGDAFSSIELYSGRRGRIAPMRLLIDDVSIIDHD